MVLNNLHQFFGVRSSLCSHYSRLLGLQLSEPITVGGVAMGLDDLGVSNIT